MLGSVSGPGVSACSVALGDPASGVGRWSWLSAARAVRHW